MHFRDRPLLPSSPDRDLYVARPLLEQALLRPLRQNRNVLLLGEAGSGKTTLMRHIAEQLEEEGRQTVWVNAALAETARDLLAMIDAALPGSASSWTSGEEAGGKARLLDLTQALAGYQPSVIFVDGLSDPEIGFDLFGRARDELWATGHSWLVAVRPKDSAALRSPPAEAFWATTVEIPPFNEEETEEFLSRGLDEDELHRLEHDLHEVPTDGFHPRLLIRELEKRLEEEPPAGGMRIGVLLHQASLLGHSEEIALVELINLGRPASAHDPELLEGLGWSRPYAQRIFSRLESANLVRSLPEPSGERAGRPRKLYEPKLIP